MARKKKRKPRYKTDPISGIRYERGSLIDVMNKAISSPKKTRYSKPRYYQKSKKPYYRRPRRRRPRYDEPEFDLSDVPWWVWVGLGTIIVAYLIYHYVILPIVQWVSENYIIFLLGFIVVFLIFAFFAFLYFRSWKRKHAEKIFFEEDQREKGLEKFVDRNGNEKWGTPEQVVVWSEKDQLINRIVEEIKAFEPAKPELRNEYAYQLSLHSWLKKSFPKADIEIQRGHSRPDIVIEDIAIEIKGPTDSQGLITIADKCMRYADNFPEGLIVVLFEVRVNEGRYQEWLESLKRKYPNVKVIRK